MSEPTKALEAQNPPTEIPLVLQHLEDHLDTIVSLPAELQRIITMMKSFPRDESIDLSSKEGLLDELEMTNKRIRMVTAASAMVERHLERMDTNLRMLEAEWKMAGLGDELQETGSEQRHRRRDGAEKHHGDKKSRSRRHRRHKVICYCGLEQDIREGDLVECANPMCTIRYFHRSCVDDEASSKKGWMCRECGKGRRKTRKPSAEQ